MHLAIILPGGCGDDGGTEIVRPGATAADTGAACVGVAWDTDAGEWGLPEGGLARPPPATADCSATNRSYAIRDLDGDGIGDLVVTRDCADERVGDTVWKVYPAASDGFGQGNEWDLPTGFSTLSFTDIGGGDGNCDTGSNVPSWRLLDMDGDARPDLVLWMQCVDGTVGGTIWRVFPNSGSGFATAIEWTLPPGFSSVAFAGRRDAEECAVGSDAPVWDVADIDGDGTIELVTTDECVDDEVGRTNWHIWTNDGTGFADVPGEWDLPTGLYAPTTEADEGRCEQSDPQPSYFLLDMDGDGVRDLVSPEDCLDSYVGERYLNAYPATGAGYQDIRIQWPLPQSYAPGSFAVASRYKPDCDLEQPSFDLLDIDGDALTDLVVYGDCTGSMLGDTHWRVHAGDGASFAAVPWDAALPLGHSSNAFEPPARKDAECAGSGDRPAWQTLDLDGDGIDSIVVTEACDDEEVGESIWRVYEARCGDDG